MLVQFVSHHYSNKLGNPGEKQVGMECFLILSFMASNTKTVYEVVDCCVYALEKFRPSTLLKVRNNVGYWFIQ